MPLHRLRKLVAVTIALAMMASLASCNEDASGVASGAMTGREMAACLKGGGKPLWSGGLARTPMQSCAMPARDQGKSCKRAADCSSVCFAETQTCGSSAGMGEYDFLDENGQHKTVAID